MNIIREGFEKIDEYLWTIDNVVVELQKKHKQGKKSYFDFNGHILYSDTVTLDNAYLAICGCTKAERLQQEQKWKDDYNREKTEHLEKIPQLTKEYIEKAKGIIDEKYMNKWIKTVPVRLSDLYKGMELQCTLDIVKMLNEDIDFENIKKTLNEQNHSGMSYSLMKLMIKTFHSKGEEFVQTLENKDRVII
jgi:hypothetical protein